jgi:hypothetical protein
LRYSRYQTVLAQQCYSTADMSNPTSSSATITESLEFEPELNYLAWKVSVETFASSKATIISSSGLLTDILTDAE